MALRITYVNDGSLAQSLGLQVDDIIFRMSGSPVFVPTSVAEALGQGNPVTLDVVRGTEVLAFVVERGPLGIGLDVSSYDEYELVKRQKAEAIDRVAATALLTTGPMVAERKTLKTIGPVSAQCIYGVHALADLAAGLREIVGGRAQGLQRKVAEARLAVDADLRRECALAGGNAVVSIDYSFSDIGDKGGYMLMVVAVGTAVVLAQEDAN